MLYNFIAIEGTIGAGKTTLATRLAEDFNGKLILENFEDNDFLPKFYQDQDKYAFPLEMSFMAARFQQLKDCLMNFDLFHSFFVADYFIVKSLIFAKKTLAEDEYQLFSRFFGLINTNIPKPDLLVYLYLNIDRLQENIKKRGRLYEQNIGDDYLEKIQTGYFEFFRQNSDMRILIIDTNNIDFVKSDNDYKKLINVINRPYEIGVHRIAF
ncbi:MAG: deoxynucleoside kinase [Lentimicrobiaceae bacterium]|jgi:deoxyadenosine/deoxycytidine kinase|nr:deoxynucleoside kinase [Lentimicrobiaceae bacterium]